MPRPVTHYLIPMLYLAIAILTLNGCTAASSASPDPQTIIIESIYWSYGDSGRINGSLKFRLNDIDAQVQSWRPTRNELAPSEMG